MWKSLSASLNVFENSQMNIDQWLSFRSKTAKNWQPLSSFLWSNSMDRQWKKNILKNRWLTSFFIAPPFIVSCHRETKCVVPLSAGRRFERQRRSHPRWNFKSTRSWVERTSWLRRSLIAFYSFFMFTFLSVREHFFPISRATRKTPLKAVFWFHSIVCFAGYSMC